MRSNELDMSGQRAFWKRGRMDTTQKKAKGIRVEYLGPTAREMVTLMSKDCWDFWN